MGAASAAPILNGLMPTPTAPRSANSPPALVPGSELITAWVCNQAVIPTNPPAAITQTGANHLRTRQSATATMSPDGIKPSTRGVHRPITARAPSGIKNQPKPRAECQSRADR